MFKAVRPKIELVRKFELGIDLFVVVGIEIKDDSL
jgi:hypothetical protein